jgi:hypothetical protein
MGFFYAMQNTGQILRSRKNGKTRYTAISNDILQSKTLTPQEKSILVHLLSLPETWIVYKGLIWKEMNMGREQFNKHWKGLVEKGYVLSIRMIDKETNLVKGWNHVVYEEPVLHEDGIDQSSDLPNLGQSENPSLNKEDIEESNNEIKELTNKEIVFNEFWDMYGKKQAKDAAERAFKSIPINLYDDIRENIPLFIKQFSDKQFQPYFSTYLNGKRWKDELKAEVKPFVINQYRKATLDDD